MIGAYGNNGTAQDAFNLLDEMPKRGIRPNSVTYIGILSACSHARFVDNGRYYWFSMLTNGIKPCFQHYACMTTLEEAVDLITNSPFANQSSELWRIVLSSCVIFKNLSVGVSAAERVIALERVYASLGE